MSTIKLGLIRSYRETILRPDQMTTGDEIELERLDCERSALRVTMIRRPLRRRALLARLHEVERAARVIVRRYS